MAGLLALQSHAEKRLAESFEAGVPSYFEASRPDSLTTSGWHSRHGKQSLEWDWQGGETVTIHHDVGRVEWVGEEPGSQRKATFGVWLYQEKPHAGAVRFEFRRGDKVDGWFDFPLDFTGWRRAALRYAFEPQFEGKVTSRTDSIVMRAPAEAGGKLFVDALAYNGLLDKKLAYLPGSKPWSPPQPSATDYPPVTTVSERAQADLAAVRQELWSQGAKRLGGEMTETRAMVMTEMLFARFGIEKDEHGIRGMPLPVYNETEVSAGLDAEGYGPSPFPLMLRVARLYHDVTQDEERQRLAEIYLLMEEYIRDQGMVAGAGCDFGELPGSLLGEATFLMGDVLAAHGLLAPALAHLEASYECGSIFSKGERLQPSMNDFYTNTPMELRVSLLQPTAAEQLRWLAACSDHLSRMILTEDGENGFKPDGSMYDHGFHYMEYAMFAMGILSNQVRALSGTQFAISRPAYDKLKDALLKARFYCNVLDAPLALHGRNPFQARMIEPLTYETLAEAGPDGLDKELAAASLRLAAAGEKLADEPELKAPYVRLRRELASIEPEKPPEGNLCLPYAGLMAQRRGSWLVTVKGCSKYVAIGETYIDHNHFGQFLGNGSLEVIGSGDPITEAASGCSREGWDYSLIPGTTTIDTAENVYGWWFTDRRTMFSEETFAGGVSHDGRNGCFGLKVYSPEPYMRGLRAQKSYFFFDNRVICLGSGINDGMVKFETVTTLFQKRLEEPNQAMIANGKVVTDFPKASSQRRGYLIDPQGIGYYLGKGNQPRWIRRRQSHKVSTGTRTGQGNFAVACLDHIRKPRNAGYEYAMVIDTTPKEMAAFTEAMDSEEAPYVVWRRDNGAHVVWDRATKTWGMVLFEAGEVKWRSPKLWQRYLNGQDAEKFGMEPPVVEVSRPCLVMAEDVSGDDQPLIRDGDWLLSVADPDLDIKDGKSRPHELEVTVRGRWDVQTRTDGLTGHAYKGESTVLTFRCVGGRSEMVSLRIPENP